MTEFNSRDYDRDRVSYMLAETILGLRDADHGITGFDGIATGSIEVDFHIKSMVREFCRKIWVDNAAISRAAQEAVLEAASKVNLPQVVNDAVDAEVAHVKRNLRDIIERQIESEVRDTVHRLVQDKLVPHLKAKAESVLSSIWHDGKTK